MFMTLFNVNGKCFEIIVSVIYMFWSYRHVKWYPYPLVFSFDQNISSESLLLDISYAVHVD